MIFLESYRMVIYEETVWRGNNSSKKKKRRNSRGGRNSNSTSFFNSNNNSSSNRKQSMYKLCLWCMNPAVAFEEIAKQTHSIILASGTLSPLDSFATELGVEFKIRLEAKHVINTKKQLWVGALGHGGKRGTSLKANYANTKTDQYKDALGDVFLRSIGKIPGGVLVFFPSYGLMANVIQRWEDTGDIDRIETFKKCFQEPKGGGKEQLEKILTEYRQKAATTGAILFAVFRGKISEGVDFSDHNARAVFIVGIPYPAWKDLKVVQKREYQDKRMKSKESTITGSQWYSQQAFRALNQALGRCIRHRHDYGAIFLLDSRYCNAPNVINQLSKWVRPSVETYKSNTRAMHDVEQFFVALEQTPPGGKKLLQARSNEARKKRVAPQMMMKTNNIANNNDNSKNKNEIKEDINRPSASTGAWISREEAARNIDLHSRGGNSWRKRKGGVRAHNRRRNKRNKDKPIISNNHDDTAYNVLEYTDIQTTQNDVNNTDVEDQRVANKLKNRNSTTSQLSLNSATTKHF